MASIPITVVFALVLFATPGDALKASSRIRETRSDTPVSKVISLLERLEVQIQEEGKAEAVQYDKYACFCKDQADSKTYAIEQSQEKIESLSAAINALSAEIADLTAQTTELGSRITEINGLVEAETTSRSAAHLEYEKQDLDVSEAIKAGEEAVKALQASKQGLTGARVDLVQLRSAAATVLAAVAALPGKGSSAAQLRAVEALASQEPGQPHAYEYKSNDVIATLQELLRDFKANKKALFESEAEAQHASDQKVLGLTNEKKFKEKAKVEKEALASAKTEEKHAAEQDKDAETAAMTADEAFRSALASDCEAKAAQWDQRSTSRSGELTAIAEALETLKTGVAPNYAANKKLAGLQRRAAVAPAAATTSAAGPTTMGAATGARTNATRIGAVEAAAPKAAATVGATVAPAATPVRAVSAAGAAKTAQAATSAKAPVVFIQLRGASAADGVRKAVEMLGGAASRLKSAELSALAAKVLLQEDHFVKVRGLIKDLIAKLEADKTAEAESKTFCDEKMKDAVGSRDTQQQEIEAQSAAVSQQQSKRAALLQDIQVLSEEIAGLHKAINEATELRREEKAINEKTLADATSGKASVEQAISVLKTYYAGTSMLQRANPPAGADRDGQTIADRAPTLSYAGDYSGKQDASKGVIGLLEVILSDFERTLETVQAAETAAQSAFDAFKTSSEATIAAKEADKSTKEDDVKTAEEAIVTAQGALSDAKTLHASALSELEKLQAMCVAGEETWEERKAKREQEIEALKQAMAILESWNS